MSISLADGMFGDEEIDVPVKGKLYSSVKIASLISKVQGFICVSHFTGHMLAGFGAAIKNMGMGCASRRGKMVQHSTAKPAIAGALCTRCGQCVKWCPTGAAMMVMTQLLLIRTNAWLRRVPCVCRFDAVNTTGVRLMRSFRRRS
jgi:uncharacterized Fe-S center protein